MKIDTNHRGLDPEFRLRQIVYKYWTAMEDIVEEPIYCIQYGGTTFIAWLGATSNQYYIKLYFNTTDKIGSRIDITTKMPDLYKEMSRWWTIFAPMIRNLVQPVFEFTKPTAHDIAETVLWREKIY